MQREREGEKRREEAEGRRERWRTDGDGDGRYRGCSRPLTSVSKCNRNLALTYGEISIRM